MRKTQARKVLNITTDYLVAIQQKPLLTIHEIRAAHHNMMCACSAMLDMIDKEGKKKPRD